MKHFKLYLLAGAAYLCTALLYLINEKCLTDLTIDLIRAQVRAAKAEITIIQHLPKELWPEHCKK